MNPWSAPRRDRSRWGALALAVLMLVTACATGTSLNGDSWESEADISDEDMDGEEALWPPCPRTSSRCKSVTPNWPLP